MKYSYPSCLINRQSRCVASRQLRSATVACRASFFSNLFGGGSSESNKNQTQRKDALPSEWWLHDAELFTAIESESDWTRQMEADGIIVVDWAAVWCRGCEKANAHVAQLVQNPDLKKKGVRWARVLMADGQSAHKALAKAQRVSKIPQLTVQRKGGEQLISFPAPQNSNDATKALTNLKTILSLGPGHHYQLDPNGFVASTGPRVVAVSATQTKPSNDSAEGGECEDDSCASDWS